MPYAFPEGNLGRVLNSQLDVSRRKMHYVVISLLIWSALQPVKEIEKAALEWYRVLSRIGGEICSWDFEYYAQ